MPEDETAALVAELAEAALATAGQQALRDAADEYPKPWVGGPHDVHYVQAWLDARADSLADGNISKPDKLIIALSNYLDKPWSDASRGYWAEVIELLGTPWTEFAADPDHPTTDPYLIGTLNRPRPVVVDSWRLSVPMPTLVEVEVPESVRDRESGSTEPVTDRQIEAAAVAIAFRKHGQSIKWWEKFGPDEKQRYGGIARLALEAAAAVSGNQDDQPGGAQ